MTWKIFWAGTLIFCALLAAYAYSLYAGFFFILWWWDIPMHVAGGVVAALIGAWWFSILGYRPAMLAALSGALVLGAGVELAEYVFGFTYSPWMSYPVDTAKDMANDFVGAALVGYFLSRS